MSERARFEAWMRSVPGRKVDLRRCDNQGPYEYIGDATECAWRAWQAALATPPAGVCVASGIYNSNRQEIDGEKLLGQIDGQVSDTLDGHKLRVWVEDLGRPEEPSDGE